MYKKILVPVDGSSTSQRGLEEAISLAKLCGAAVRFVHVVNELIIANDFLAINYGELVDRLRDDGQKILDAAAARARAKGVASESDLIETIGGQAAREILNVSRKWGADLIVMGTHGRRGIRRLALGSDAEVVLRNSSVPVLLVRDAQEEH